MAEKLQQHQTAQCTGFSLSGASSNSGATYSNPDVWAIIPTGTYFEVGSISHYAFATIDS